MCVLGYVALHQYAPTTVEYPHHVVVVVLANPTINTYTYRGVINIIYRGSRINRRVP